MNWFKRWQQRRYEIAQGADEDLFRDNRQRYQRGFVLLAAGLLLGWTASKVQLAQTLHTVATITATLLATAGAFFLWWARKVDAFLRSPEKEGPPSIFRR